MAFFGTRSMFGQVEDNNECVDCQYDKLNLCCKNISHYFYWEIYLCRNWLLKRFSLCCSVNVEAPVAMQKKFDSELQNLSKRLNLIEIEFVSRI
jgi:hypothetical protein